MVHNLVSSILDNPSGTANKRKVPGHFEFLPVVHNLVPSILDNPSGQSGEGKVPGQL